MHFTSKSQLILGCDLSAVWGELNYIQKQGVGTVYMK